MSQSIAQDHPELRWLREESARGTLAGRKGKKFTNIYALSSQHNLEVLEAVAREIKPRNSMEIGLAFGGSALILSELHRELGSAPQRQHMAIDPFQSTLWDDLGRMMLEKAGLSDFVDVREDFSAFVLPQLLKAKAGFDLIYIDGSHIFEDVFVDCYFSVQLLREGGVVLFDDCTDRHVHKVLRFIDANFREICRKMDLARYRPAAGGAAGLQYKLARALGKVQLTGYQKIGPSPRKWNAPFHSF